MFSLLLNALVRVRPFHVHFTVHRVRCGRRIWRPVLLLRAGNPMSKSVCQATGRTAQALHTLRRAPGCGSLLQVKVLALRTISLSSETRVRQCILSIQSIHLQSTLCQQAALLIFTIETAIIYTKVPAHYSIQPLFETHS